MHKFRIVMAFFAFFYGNLLFAQAPLAAQVFETAKSQAGQQRKDIFLVFGASWCRPCHLQEAFMEAPEIRPILEKYFVLTHLSVEEEVGKHPELNSPGGEDLMARFGGTDAGGKAVGVPFLVFLDAGGSVIVDSNRPVKGKTVGENIGYPSAPEEIDWFMMMLKKAVPGMSAEELSTIDGWLRKHSVN
jgi:thioredoxin-related protein